MARELKGEKLEKELLRLEEMKAYEKENDAVHAMFRAGLNECVQLERKGS